MANLSPGRPVALAGTVPPLRGGDRLRAAARAFEVVNRAGPLSRSALRSRMRVGLSTVTAAVQELVDGGYVAEVGHAASTGGRPPGLLDLAPSVGHVLAADLGGSNLRFAVADLRGTILYRSTIPTDRALAEAKTLRQAVIEGLRTARDHAPGGATRAIAVSVAGIVDPASGAVSRVDNIPTWREGDDLSWLLPLASRVLVDNEANLGALGEHRASEGADADHLLFISLGAGIGAGLLLGGSMYRGATGAAGEIGLLRRGAPGATVELERVAAAGALVEGYESRGGEAGVTAETVVRLADGDDADPRARAALAAVLDELAVGIANAVIILNPGTVVLGGGLARAQQRILEPLRERLAGLVPSVPELSIGRLGTEAPLVGAVEWAAGVAESDAVAELQAGAVAHG